MIVALLFYSVFIYLAHAKVSDDLMDDWNAVASTYADECIEESEANPIVAKNMFKNHKLHDEEHIQCFIKCLNYKLKFLTDVGVYDKERFVNTLQHVTREIVDKCVEKHKFETNECKNSYLVAACFAEENYITE
ncbi:hypothetical protein FQR65_LT12147 [Abscondita terminalis]|nr:hypothetical protein FQR65_LT12147 [Abscondita terminalis]